MPARSAERSSPIRAASRRRLRAGAVLATPEGCSVRGTAQRQVRKPGFGRTRSAVKWATTNDGNQGTTMSYDLEAARLKKDWAENPRWKGIQRGYTADDVIRLRGSLHIEHTLAKR